MSIDVRYVAESVINNKHGWSVAEQFVDTYDGGQSLDQQSYRALEMVAAELKELVRSEVLAEGYELEELKRYLARVEQHLDTV